MSPETSSEVELLRRIRAGEKDLFSVLVSEHQVKVYRLCLAYLHDPDEAEEAAQEVFVKAYQALDRFGGSSAFLTWITRIGINHCKDLLRKRRIRRFVPLDLFTSGEAAHPPQLRVDPVAGERHGMEEARRILESLPAADREVLILAEVEELSYEEMARTLGTSLDAVKGRLKRARQRLRDAAGGS